MKPVIRRLKVHPWPQAQGEALTELASAQAITVLSVVTASNTMRATGRQLIRAALCAVLATHTGQLPKTISFGINAPDASPLTWSGQPIGFSVSHEAGLTLGAIHRLGPIGIDVMRIEALPDWALVAIDYLGRDTYERLMATPTSQRPHAFGREWTRLEACLKCLGVGLIECDAGLARRRSLCRIFELALPDGLAGTVAV